MFAVVVQIRQGMDPLREQREQKIAVSLLGDYSKIGWPSVPDSATHATPLICARCICSQRYHAAMPSPVVADTGST